MELRSYSSDEYQGGEHDGVPAYEPVGDHQEEVVAVEWEKVSHQHLEGVVWATNGQ